MTQAIERSEAYELFFNSLKAKLNSEGVKDG